MVFLKWLWPIDESSANFRRFRQIPCRCQWHHPHWKWKRILTERRGGIKSDKSRAVAKFLGTLSFLGGEQLLWQIFKPKTKTLKLFFSMAANAKLPLCYSNRRAFSSPQIIIIVRKLWILNQQNRHRDN